ncbi:MAG: alcohol dehydrogenase catalytic domain-containing protein [candidate division KSB1 bacterium]|nr:alcohol dehydrogenase catalytic domain-containing protein [candidate division KSB1 bacterium]MDZ7295202.1 alcohol dehydrogenase catalytic domain-containing protein [candidate division KSB1 bacterium]MDZ7337090.1 alcohol dehydrogenase catalytic domain-containing protein [candidate division KSB1 bacterium]MDZ7386564.1 alcohol dehydrogenase catalytic domain-containing protein [candidate division KSB1 bacterium]MDZ7392451.1 alcohol dehydrogenase catalytic domain-containing protein [candidate div
MKALVMEKSLRLTELERPALQEGEALVRVLRAGICNTDMEIVRGYMGFEGVLGHEFVGVVEQCQDTRWLNKRVVAEINVGCGKCRYCQRGLSRHCPNRTVVGIQGRSGVFAEYVALPTANLIEVPSTISDLEAVWVEPLAASAEILAQVHIQPEDRVAIIGDGKLAALVAQVLRLIGCALIVVGKHQPKLATLSQLGIPTTLRNNLPKRSYSLVVEASGSPSGLDLALQLVEPRGTVVVKSTYAERPTMDLSHIVVDEITLVGSRCGPFDTAIRLLRQKLVQVEPLVTQTFPFSQALEAFTFAQQDHVLKVQLDMSG